MRIAIYAFSVSLKRVSQDSRFFIVKIFLCFILFRVFKNHKIIILIGILIMVVVSVAAFIGKRAAISVESGDDGATDNPAFTRGAQPGDTIISMTPEGFLPEEVNIKQGETVTWVNNDTALRWPASNLHPTHAIYQEFDPQEPLDSGESWSFRFDKVGNWRSHDHLKPEFRGMIDVK